jgi:TRAP-type C4-dicarboxylate transport system permease small subunit
VGFFARKAGDEVKKPVSLVIVYIYLAVSCTLVGVVFTFALLFACQYFSIDISENWWLLALPVTLSVSLNIMLLELFRKYRNQ